MSKADSSKDEARKSKTAFFDYFNRAIREGLTETEAYRWAITEDMYDAEDRPIFPDETTADGMCYHPQFVIGDKDGSPGKQIGICQICGEVVAEFWFGKYYHEQSRFKGAPRKISTRRECLLAVLSSIGLDEDLSYSSRGDGSLE